MNWDIVSAYNTMDQSPPQTTNIEELNQIPRGESPAAMSSVLCGMTTIVQDGAMLLAQVIAFTIFPVQKTQAPPSATLKMEMVAMHRAPIRTGMLAPLPTMLRLIEGNARIG